MFYPSTEILWAVGPQPCLIIALKTKMGRGGRGEGLRVPERSRTAGVVEVTQNILLSNSVGFYI